MKKLPRLLFVLFACLSMTSYAQSKTTKKATDREKVDVVKVYEEVVLEGFGTPYIYKELANAYYFKSDYVQAKKWFEELFEVEKLSDDTLKHRYRQTLKALSLEFKNNEYLAKSGSN